MKIISKGYEGNGFECERAAERNDHTQHHQYQPTMAPCRDCSENAYCSEGNFIS